MHFYSVKNSLNPRKSRWLLQRRINSKYHLKLKIFPPTISLNNMIVLWYTGGPQLGPPDAERPQSLEQLAISLSVAVFLSTLRKLYPPIPFTLNGIWSWFDSFFLWFSESSGIPFVFKIERKTVVTIISHSIWEEMEI